MTNIIVIAVIVLVVGSATAYVIRAKRKGKKCIGCPSGTSCKASSCQQCQCNCHQYGKK